MHTKHAIAHLANGGNVDTEPAVDIFMPQNMIQPATAFLFDALKDNQPEQGHPQTQHLELSLVHAPGRCAILGSEMLTLYDRPRIADQCEKACLIQHACQALQCKIPVP